MPQISIIANFYKSEKYIDKLIKSVLGQTFTDWELIAVNDCSPGRDSDILHRWAEKDARIRVIDNPENLGISRAKKVGIDAARGEYMTFIDGDDWLAKDALAEMHRAAIDFGVDVVAMQGYKILPLFGYKQEMRHGVPTSFINRRIEGDELMDECFVNFFGKYKFGVAYWGKLYRTSIVQALDFEYPDAAHTAGEDYKFSLHLFQRIKSMAFIPYMGYFWRWGGITSGKANKDWRAEKFIFEHLDFYLERKQLLDRYHYDKGFKWLLIELKNVIIYGVSQVLVSGYDTSDTEPMVKKILNHPATKDVCLLEDYPEYSGDESVLALTQGNVQKILSIAEDINRKSHIKRSMRSFIYKLISVFS